MGLALSGWGAEPLVRFTALDTALRPYEEVFRAGKSERVTGALPPGISIAAGPTCDAVYAIVTRDDGSQGFGVRSRRPDLCASYLWVVEGSHEWPAREKEILDVSFDYLAVDGGQLHFTVTFLDGLKGELAGMCHFDGPFGEWPGLSLWTQADAVTWREARVQLRVTEGTGRISLCFQAPAYDGTKVALVRNARMQQTWMD